jgi:hypothetical protein
MDAALPPTEVTVRCGLCVADLGMAAPAMAAVRRHVAPDQWDGRWRIYLLVRTGRGNRATGQKLMGATADRLGGGTLTGYRTDGRGVRRPLPGRVDRRLAPATGRLGLICHRCRWRPPVSRRTVYQLVDQAAAAGRCDVYLD